MYDSTSLKAAELLSYFGRNTAVTVSHDYGSKECQVISARTGNVIVTVTFKDNADLVILNEEVHTIPVAVSMIESMKKFPKNRKMNRTWSPIRLTARAEADAEVTRATIAWVAE